VGWVLLLLLLQWVARAGGRTAHLRRHRRLTAVWGGMGTAVAAAVVSEGGGGGVTAHRCRCRRLTAGWGGVHAAAAAAVSEGSGGGRRTVVVIV